MEQVDALLQTAVAYEIRGGQALDKGEWAAAADYLRLVEQLRSISALVETPSPR